MKKDLVIQKESLSLVFNQTKMKQSWKQIFDEEVKQVLVDRKKQSKEYKLTQALNKIRRLTTDLRILNIVVDVLEETKES